MDLQTVIFTGRSGCGKGTQSDLLTKYLEEQDPARTVYHLQTGAGFRAFLEQDGYTASLSKDIYHTGGLQPDFLTVWNWTDALVKNFKENQHLIIDGSPRRPSQVAMMNDTLDFYGRESRVVISIDVSPEWATERLTKRGRVDDVRAGDIAKRQEWYETLVKPTIEELAKDSKYRYVSVNGEQAIDAVHRDVVRALYPDGTH